MKLLAHNACWAQATLQAVIMEDGTPENEREPEIHSLALTHINTKSKSCRTTAPICAPKLPSTLHFPENIFHFHDVWWHSGR